MKRVIILVLAGFVLLIMGMASGVALVMIDMPSQPAPRLETVKIIAVSFSTAADRFGRE
jgi:hypothetical protein